MKTALKSSELGATLTRDDVHLLKGEREIAMTIAEVGDNSLRKIKDFIATKSAWNKLHPKYSGKTTGNKLELLPTLFNFRKEKGQNMGSHVSCSAALFYKLKFHSDNNKSST